MKPTRAQRLPDQPRLLYHAGAVEIDLEVGASKRAGRRCLLGHVMAESADLLRATVAVQGPDGRVEAEVDELGRFTLDGLTSGPLRLEISLAGGLIEIPEIQI